MVVYIAVSCYKKEKPKSKTMLSNFSWYISYKEISEFSLVRCHEFIEETNVVLGE